MAAANPEMPNFAAFGLLKPGARLARYEIVRSAGRGGMAVVWQARSVDGSETVALKTLLPTLSLEADFEKMFRAEAAVGSRVQHPNVCAVRESGSADGVLYMVMDWVEGATLASLAEAAPLPYGIATRIVLDVARGLAAAHVATRADGTPLNLVHRDVSPQNVLVGIDGCAKIADFGVAKASLNSTATRSGFLKGKVRYMSPEQAYCEPVDARTDVFALGLVLQEVTTGEHPLAAETDVGTLTKLASVEPIAAPTTADFPPALRDVIAKAVSKDAADRYDSMGDLASALEDVLARLEQNGASDVAELVRKTASRAPTPVAIDIDVAASPSAQSAQASAASRRAPVVLGFLGATFVVAAVAFGMRSNANVASVRAPEAPAPREASSAMVATVSSAELSAAAAATAPDAPPTPLASAASTNKVQNTPITPPPRLRLPARAAAPGPAAIVARDPSPAAPAAQAAVPIASAASSANVLRTRD